jgi:MFS family permease
VREPPPLGAIERRALAVVAFTLFLDLAGFGVILPVLPFYASSFGVDARAVTMLSTAFSLMQFAMSPVLGRLSDNYGRRPVMLVSIFGSVIAGLVLGFANTFLIVVIARLVAGASKANVSTAQAYVADLVPYAQRAKWMGLMGAAMGVGFIFGPALGGLLSTKELPTLPFFVSAGLAAVNFVLAWLYLPETRGRRRTAGLGDAASAHEQGRSRRPRFNVEDVWARLWGKPLGWLIVITFVYFFSFASMEATFALFTERAYGWTSRETGYYLTYLGVCIALVQGLLVGRLVAWLREIRTLRLGTCAIGLGLLLLGGGGWLGEALGFGVQAEGAGLTTATFVALIAGATLMAIGNGLVTSTVGALVSQVSSESEQGYSMGLRESAAALARITGPIAAGFAFEWIAPSAGILLGGLLAFVNVAFTFGLQRDRAAIRR